MWDETNPLKIEAQLQEQLSGKRLVGELDLSPEGGTFQSARSAFLRVTTTRQYARLRRYPAVTVVYLAGEGGRSYDDGTFWPNIESLEEASAAEQTDVGTAFESAVRELGLEDFSKSPEAVRWMRYVTPILLHGGIPASNAHDAADLVVSEVRNGVGDSVELIEGVLRSATRRAQLNRPVRRFFSYGGDFALDLVERMIAAVFDIEAIGLELAQCSVSELAQDSGLPEYLIEALIGCGSPGVTAKHRRRPRPHVQIDRYSCGGPFAVLPPVRDGGEWLLTGSSTSRFATMKHDAHEVPLIPSRVGWVVSRRSEVASQETHFNGHPDAAAYIFDADGRLARDQRRLRGSVALVLAAKEVEVLAGDGTPPTLAEDLPARSEPWHGWKLMCLDISETDDLELRSTGIDQQLRSAKLPVLKPPESPAVSSTPVSAVKGPEGCNVYAETPNVKEPEGTSPTAWRVRWRGDDDPAPPPTALLENFASGPNGRSLATCLPDEAAFCGTVEVAGPLGSDLRERVAVVRGLQVTVPDRVVGPEETVDVTVSADCTLNWLDVSGCSLAVRFEPDSESIEISADGVPLTITIPRLSWAVSYRNKPSEGFSGRCQQISLEDIESGEADSILVRCGRPAMIGLQLRGGLTGSAAPVSVDGDRGRWAFSLAQFRDDISASRQTNVPLRLEADDVHAEAAVVFARFKVSELRVEVPDSDGSAALVSVDWHQNRGFRNRQLRLWPQHRPWQPPYCEDIPDDMSDSNSGYFECLVEAPPGPYLAEVVVRDDWAPTRPGPGAGAVEFRIGSEPDMRSRLAALSPVVAQEALELVVAGHPNADRIDPDNVDLRGSELREAISSSAAPAVSFAVLKRLVDLASSADSSLAEMLAEEMVGHLPELHLLRIALAMMSAPVCHDLDPDTIETLWRAEPVVGAVVDRHLDDFSEDRWERFTGWVPSDGDDPEQPSEPVNKPLDEFSAERLAGVADSLPPMESLALQFGGYVDAALEMLSNSLPERRSLNEWMSAHTRVTTHTQRLTASQQQRIEALTPDSPEPAVWQGYGLRSLSSGAAGWHSFPARLQAVAFQITDGTLDPAVRDSVVEVLLEAAEIAPLLTKRCLLVAVADLVEPLSRKRE